MKKLALVLMLTLFLSACSTEPSTTEAVTTEAATEAQTEAVTEAETEASTGKEIVLGQPLEVGDYTVTIQSYQLAKNFDGGDALVINYDWVNNSDAAASPFMTFMIKGFQDGVETSDEGYVEEVDLGMGQKEVKPGGQITGAQDVIGIDDINKPLLIELDELITFEENPYSATLDLSTIGE